MAISYLRWLGNYIEDVYWNAALVDFVQWNGVQVFQRVVPAGSVTFNYTGSGVNWPVPEGITSITICAAGGGGGGGAGRGGGGGGGGAVNAPRTVSFGQTLGVYAGRGGTGSNTWNVRGASGEASSVTAAGFSSVFAFGAQGGLTDTTATGGSGGGAGGDGNPPTAGGNFSGCGGSFTGGAGGASSGGGGGAGGFGNGQAAYSSGPTDMPRANVSAGGGGIQNGEPIVSGYRGGDGGHGRVVISWAEQ